MRKTVLLILFAIVSVVANAQVKGFDPNKLVYGGQIGFGFGSNDYWSLYLSPQLGYRFTNNFIAGAGVSYSYANQKYHWASALDEVKEQQHQFGINLYADYYFTKRFFFTVKPELFYQKETLKWDNDEGVKQKLTENRFVPALLLGVGISLKPVILSLNYDVVQNSSTPYGDSVFLSVGFSF